MKIQIIQTTIIKKVPSRSLVQWHLCSSSGDIYHSLLSNTSLAKSDRKDSMLLFVWVSNISTISFVKNNSSASFSFSTFLEYAVRPGLFVITLCWDWRPTLVGFMFVSKISCFFFNLEWVNSLSKGSPFQATAWVPNCL